MAALLDGKKDRKKRGRRRGKRGLRNARCPLCNNQRGFLWTCDCGMIICQQCMERDIWGYSCNNITWVCADCGAVHSF